MTTEAKNIETEAVSAFSRFLDTHLPPNRVVMLFGPVVAIIAGAVASWLATHFPGLNLDTSSTAGMITQGINFAIGALVTLALQHKWLAGWQQYEANKTSTGTGDPNLAAALLAAVPPTALPPLQPSGEYNPALDAPTTVNTVPAQPQTGPPEGTGSPSDGAWE